MGKFTWIWSRTVVLLLLVMVFAPAVFASQSSGFIGVSGQYRYGDPVIGDPMYGIGFHGSLDHRMLLGDHALLGISAYGRVSYDLGGSGLSDLSMIDLWGTWFVGSDTLEARVDTEQSIGGYEGTPGYFMPSWQVAYRFDRGYRVLNPFVSYDGTIDASMSSNGITLGFSYAPKVELQYSASIGGGLEHVQGNIRPDILGTLALGVEGLSGYYFSWSVGTDASYRAAAVSADAAFSGTLFSLFRFSPTMQYQINVSPKIEWEYIVDANTVDADVEIAVRADVAATERFYWYVEAIGGIDGLFGGLAPVWQAQLVAGVDFSF